MKYEYIFEPSQMEITITELAGNTLAKPYYRKLAEKLGAAVDDKVLDYCSGSGIIAKEILKRLGQGQLVYADVSEKWLLHAAKKLKHNKNAMREKIRDFQGKISGGEYDKILVHFSLHDFPKEYRLLIINQLVANLKLTGRLYIREPLSITHGFQLHELINLLEYTKKLSYEYKIAKNRFVGECVEIDASLKPNKKEIEFN